MFEYVDSLFQRWNRVSIVVRIRVQGSSCPRRLALDESFLLQCELEFSKLSVTHRALHKVPGEGHKPLSRIRNADVRYLRLQRKFGAHEWSFRFVRLDTGTKRKRPIADTRNATPRYQSSVDTNTAPAKNRLSNTINMSMANGLHQSNRFPMWIPTSRFDQPDLVRIIGSFQFGIVISLAHIISHDPTLRSSDGKPARDTSSNDVLRNPRIMWLQSSWVGPIDQDGHRHGNFHLSECL
jgi:hypothetical protein